MELREAVMIRNRLASFEEKLCLNTINQMNAKMKELIDEKVGPKLFQSCARDIAGEVVRNYLNTSAYHITVDQMLERILRFEYNQDFDPLAQQSSRSKDVYNANDYAGLSEELQRIDARNREASREVFPGKREGSEPFYDEEGKRYGSRTAYKDKMNEGRDTMRDDLTDREVDEATIEGDHIRAVKSAKYNSRYLGDKYTDAMKVKYNSSDNMEWIDKIANASKGNAATAEETIKRWENANPKTKEHLIENGYLNEDGKVPGSVRKKLEGNYRDIGNVESMKALRTAHYGQMGKDALADTSRSFTKVLSGQIIYYTLPPLYYEIKTFFRYGNRTLGDFFDHMKKGVKRLAKYVLSKLKTIFAGVAGGLFKNFVKTFFDILISILKETVKKAVSLVKNLVMALIGAVKILFDKNATRAQKADSVFNLISATLTTFVIDVLFEYAQKQFGIPSFIVEPLQMLATVVVLNLVMLILQKADLFDVRYGLLVANIEKVFEESNAIYQHEITLAERLTNQRVEEILVETDREIGEIRDRLASFDPHAEFVQQDLEKINRMFNMNIDFEKEWNGFLGFAT